MKKTIIYLSLFGLIFGVSMLLLANKTYAIPSLNTYTDTVDDMLPEGTGEVNAAVNELNDAVNSAEDLTNIDSRKEVIVATDDAALAALSAADDVIQQSQNLSAAQKQQLDSCTDMTEARVNTHKSSVQAATTTEQLLAAHQAYLQGVAADAPQVKACVYTATALGIQSYLITSKEFLTYSQKYIQFLPDSCLENGGNELNNLATDGLQNVIPSAENNLNKVFADQKITPDEVNTIDQLVTDLVELTEINMSVYTGITSGLELCM